MTTNPTAAERIRSAEETISKAQSALDAAQEGLHAAEKVAATVDGVRSNPWAKAGIGALLALIVLGIVMMLRNEGR